MVVRSLTEAIDNLYTTTWQNMGSSVADQIFDGTPFWFWMRKKGMLKSTEGGRYISAPVRYAKNESITWVRKGSSVSLDDYEFLTTAQYDWRYVVATIVRFGIDDQQNRGRNAIIDLMNAKLENARDSLTDELEIRSTGTAGTDQMHGLQDLVADDPTTGTLGTIDSSVNTWWRNQTQTMTGSSFATNGTSTMTTMINNCSKNQRQDSPDIIVTGQTPYEYLKDATLEQKRIVNRTLGDAGFQNIEFEGLPVIWSPQIALRMYFLNTRFMMLKYDPMMYFDMTEWKVIPTQVNDRAAQIVLAGNLITNRRRVLGVMHTIDTP